MFKKNIIACYYFGIILCLWFLIPALLMVDLYPFLRFGMYAEKPIKNTESEFFFIEIFENEQKILFKSENLGFNEGHFQYIIRHFVYQKKIEQFFSQIFYYFEKKQKIYKNYTENHKDYSKKNYKEKYKIKCIIYQKIYFPKNKEILPKIKKIVEKERFF